MTSDLFPGGAQPATASPMSQLSSDSLGGDIQLSLQKCSVASNSDSSEHNAAASPSRDSDVQSSHEHATRDTGDLPAGGSSSRASEMDADPRSNT